MNLIYTCMHNTKLVIEFNQMDLIIIVWVEIKINKIKIRLNIQLLQSRGTNNKI